MRGRIEILGLQSIFTNDDTISVQVTLKREYNDHFSPDLVDAVDLSLVCESRFTKANKTPSCETLYEGKLVHAALAETGRGFAVYDAKLRFPVMALSPNESLLGSLTFDGTRDGIRWFIRGDVHWHKGAGGQLGTDRLEKLCVFKPTAPMPPLLDLVDTEHSEEVGGVPVSVVTTHAVAGLPQVPLKAGLGLRVACARPNRFTVLRLRLLLRESTFVEGSGALPCRRWLVGDIRPVPGIVLSQVCNDLDPVTENLSIDHATLSPSFHTNGISHRFDLITELTLEWLAGPGTRQSHKIVSVSPVEILPKISGARYTPRRDSDSKEEPFFDPAEITDTSDEDVFESDPESGLESATESITSVFSDHSKRDTALSISVVAPDF